jgi:flagellar hook assembly protein FlgD
MNIDFDSNKQFEAIVKNSEGEKVWQLSSHSSYTLPTSSLKLAVGESKRFTAQWDQKDDQGVRVPDGSYTIEASITSHDSYYGGALPPRSL